MKVIAVLAQYTLYCFQYILQLILEWLACNKEDISEYDYAYHAKNY